MPQRMTSTTFGSKVCQFLDIRILLVGTVRLLSGRHGAGTDSPGAEHELREGRRYDAERLNTKPARRDKISEGRDLIKSHQLLNQLSY